MIIMFHLPRAKVIAKRGSSTFFCQSSLIVLIDPKRYEKTKDAKAVREIVNLGQEAMANGGC